MYDADGSGELDKDEFIMFLQTAGEGLGLRAQTAGEGLGLRVRTAGEG